jgi:hypothetical protein
MVSYGGRVSIRSRGVLVVLVASAAALLAVVVGNARDGQGPGGPPPDPIVVAGAAGAYALAVPALAGRPAISGDSVSFAVEDKARERLFSIGQASADGGWRTLYTAPAKRPGSASLLTASRRRVLVLRYPPRQVQTCQVGGGCSPSRAELIGGSASGPLARLFGATERLEPRGSCRHRIAQLGDSGGAEEVSLSGDRIAYSRWVRCLAPRRRGHWQVVVRDLRTGAVRVVGRRAAVDVQLAGGFLAFRPDVRAGDEVGATVINLRTGRVAYRARAAEWYSLGADGKLAVALFPQCCSLVGRLGWHSPQQPRLHRLPNRVSIFTASPLSYAEGRIAYVRSHGADGYALAVTDLRGNARVHAAFPGPLELESFAFDGTRLAFAHTRYRPDQGSADDGLRAICVDDQTLVQASATVIETYPVDHPARLPAEQLPVADPYRSPAETRPECPYRD